MVKADIARSISKETIRRVIQKSEQPEMNLFLVKRNPDQKWSEIETYEIAQKVCCKCTVQLYEIWNHQKAYGYRENEVNLLKSAHYY